MNKFYTILWDTLCTQEYNFGQFWALKGLMRKRVPNLYYLSILADVIFDSPLIHQHLRMRSQASYQMAPYHSSTAFEHFEAFLCNCHLRPYYPLLPPTPSGR